MDICCLLWLVDVYGGNHKWHGENAGFTLQRHLSTIGHILSFNSNNILLILQLFYNFDFGKFLRITNVFVLKQRTMIFYDELEYIHLSTFERQFRYEQSFKYFDIVKTISRDPKTCSTTSCIPPLQQGSHSWLPIR